MYQKLEDRLKLYEQDHPIKDDDGLIKAIEDILNEQESLPVEERDFDLISEATNTILKLQGYDENHLDEMASEAAAFVRTRIVDKRKGTSNGQLKSKRHHVLRWVIPLVAILVITTVAVFASPTNRLAISDITHNIYASLNPKSVYHDDNIDLVITKDKSTYSSFKELSETFNYAIMLPFDIEDELEEMSIDAFDLGKSFSINISFTHNGRNCSLMIITPQDSANSNIKYNTIIGNMEISLNTTENLNQAEWFYQNAYYKIKSSSIDLVIAITNNMRYYE